MLSLADEGGMPVSRERMDVEGVDPEERQHEHRAKIARVRLGRRVDLRAWEDALEFCASSPIDKSDFETHDEDVVKQVVRLALEQDGWSITSIRWGQEHGTDIVAERGGDEVLAVEAKGMRRGQPGFRNYALVAIGQIAMARERPEWRCAVAFPAAREYARVISRLPDSFRSTMRLAAFFVKREGETYSIAVLGAPVQ